MIQTEYSQEFFCGNSGALNKLNILYVLPIWYSFSCCLGCNLNIAMRKLLTTTICYVQEGSENPERLEFLVLLKGKSQRVRGLPRNRRLLPVSPLCMILAYRSSGIRVTCPV